MPTAVVLLPSTTYRASDFVRAAEGLGVDLVVASEQEPAIDMGDRYLRIDCSDPQRAAEQIVALGDLAPLDAVVAADDAGVVIAAVAADRLGVRGNTPDSAAASRDKARQRRLLAAAEVPQPPYAVVEPGADPAEAAEQVGYPLVVKPRDRSASQGVIRVDRPDQLDAAVTTVREIVGSSDGLIVEGYMDGVEVALEGLLADGELTPLAIFDKPDTRDGPYFPETILITPSRLEASAKAEVRRVAAAAVGAMGLANGPVHVEMKVEGERARVIEVAARSVGGLCSKSLNFGLMGTSLETLILRNALGMDKPELHREPVASGVLMIPIPRQGRLVEIRGLDQVREIEAVSAIDITTPPGTELAPPPHGDRYLGFVFARADTPSVVEKALRRAMAVIEVITK